MCLDNPARETNQPQKKLFIFIVIKVTIRSYFLFHIIEFIHLLISLSVSPSANLGNE